MSCGTTLNGLNPLLSTSPECDLWGNGSLLQRIHKTIDREGLRFREALTDIFGHNGRTTLDGLVQGRAAEEVLAELTYHVRSQLGRLALALEAELDAHSIWRLHGLLQDCDAVQERLAELDERVRDAYREHRRQLNLLETIPGIRRTSAHAILAEIGPDPAGTFPKAADMAAWAGVCPGNNESAGARVAATLRCATR